MSENRNYFQNIITEKEGIHMKKFTIILITLILSTLIFAVNDQYKVTQDECIGCGICVTACPFEAIEMKDDKAIIDQEKCTACGICVVGNDDDYLGCPTEAIKKLELKEKEN